MSRRPADRDRVLGERLLTIEWRQRELPEADHLDPAGGCWSALPRRGCRGDKLTDALKVGRAMHDHDLATASRPSGQRARAGSSYSCRRIGGVIVLTGPKDGNPDEECAVRGEEYVRHLVRIARELPDIPGEPPRLYLVTRSAQAVLAGDMANFQQAGLRGLMRVIGAEHPHLRATQIDIDEDTDTEQLARQLLGRFEEDETAWRNGQWYTARLSPAPLRPEERQTAVVNHEQRRDAAADPQAGRPRVD